MKAEDDYLPIKLLEPKAPSQGVVGSHLRTSRISKQGPNRYEIHKIRELKE